jgi:putative endonuclease
MEQGLQVVVRNHRCRQGEVDLICRQGSVLVFVEVRLRRRGAPVGAGESIDLFKQARIRHAALHYLSQLGQMPPCRFDAVLFEGASIQWLQNILE